MALWSMTMTLSMCVESVDAGMFAGNVPAVVEVAEQGAAKNVVDEGGFSRTGHAGDAP